MMGSDTDGRSKDLSFIDWTPSKITASLQAMKDGNGATQYTQDGLGDQY
jgi:hypothetical protein